MKTYFFIDGQLNKKLSVIKSENILVAWNYPEEKRVWLDRFYVERNYENAYNVNQVAQLLERKPNEIKTLLYKNVIDHPSGISYAIASRMPGPLYWSEQDVLRLRDRIWDIAAKNKYGEPYPRFKLISKQELISKLHGESAYYLKNEDGELIKVWRNI